MTTSKLQIPIPKRRWSKHRGGNLSIESPWRLGVGNWRLTVATALVAVLLSSATAQSRPSRIVSLVPAVTEMLYAIGAGDRVVGVSSFDRFPPEIERVPRVGALLDPDVERILSLRPDLVIVYRSQQDLLTQLGRARIATFVYAHSGLADVTTTLRQVGERVGAAERSIAVSAEIDRRIDEVRRSANSSNSSKPHPATLIVFGRDAFALRGIYASGGIGFIHDMVTAAGGRNVFSDTKREAVQVTTELIIARAPEIILELRADPLDAAAESRELKTWGALSSVPAVRNGRVHIVADPRTVIPGPRVADGVELIARVLRGGR
jgi:iron complex transport system substrate-binding protein